VKINLFNFIQKKSPASISGEVNAIVIQFSGDSNSAEKVKASGESFDFHRNFATLRTPHPYVSPD
jgi:hypothetical protein